MRARLASTIAGALGAAVLLTASPAAAATEFGSSCLAGEGQADLTIVSLQHGPGSPLPVAAPVSGVISSWTLNSALAVPPELAGVYAQKLQLWRSTGAPLQLRLVGESAAGPIGAGVNTFATRIPVQAGDLIGLGGTFLVLYCKTGDPADLVGYTELEPGAVLGGVLNFETDAGFQIPVAARIEPDADGDGYGDETQDSCPQSAAYQTPCPVVVLDAYGQAGGRALTVSVATSLAAKVTVSGVVKLGDGKTAQLSAKAKTVNPGKLGKFKLQFPQALRDRLKELPPGKKLTVKVTAKATNLAGKASTDKLKAKLRGQG